MIWPLEVRDAIDALEAEHGVKLVSAEHCAEWKARALAAETEMNEALALLDGWDDAVRFSRLLEELRTGSLVSEAARLAAEARVSGLVEALREAARQFRKYEKAHLAKVTIAATQKAFVNAAKAAMCEAAIADARALLSPVHGVGGDQGAAVAESASEGLRPFASDSVAEVGGGE